MVHSQTWCLRKPSHWNENASTHFLTWVQGTAWGALDANRPSTPSLEGYPLWGLRYYSTKRLFHVGTPHAAQPLLLVVKTSYRSNVSLFPGVAWRCLRTLVIFAVMVVLVVCWPLVDGEQGCCRLLPSSRAGPYGAFRGQTPPPWPLLAPCFRKAVVSWACSKSQKPGLRINDGKGVNISNKNNTWDKRTGKNLNRKSAIGQ